MNIKITKIIHKTSLVLIYLSDRKKPLPLSKNFLIDNQLVENIVLTESQLALIETEAEQINCDQRAVMILSVRAHSVGELRLKLKQKQFSEQSIEPVLQKYINNGFLDDQKYALRLAERISESKPSGRSYIVSHLQKKQISRYLAETAVDSVLAKIDINEQALLALNRRWRSLADLELEEAKKKAYNYLSRRGFSYEAARLAFEKLRSKNEE